MSKREIPINADENTRFLIIMDGLLDDLGLKDPKDGRYDPELGPTKWTFFKEKTDGMTEGFLVKKTVDPTLRKSQHVWLYKACLNKDYEWYFYESFGELVGCELFRYFLGDIAPKNRMTQIPGEAPGIVSKFLPNFMTFKDELERLDSDELKQDFVQKIHLIDGIPEIIAATCFFNDFDGKFANIGTMIDERGQRRAARIDYGCALSNLNNHTYGIGLYLFNEGEFSETFKHAITYSHLIHSEQFRQSILKLSQINMDHVSAIVRAAVARFSKAWKDIPLDVKAIDKLYNHLYGSDKTLWQCGYESGPPVTINFDVFSTEMSDQIIHALSTRKSIFEFFANALSLQTTLKSIIEHGEESVIESQDLEHCKALFQEAMHNSEKNYIITHLTGQVESPQITSRLSHLK